MPVLKHFSGNCHVYVDKSAFLDMAERILIDAKCQRMGVCNAAESLLVHRDIAQGYLPRIAEQLRSRNVEILGDEATCQILPGIREATESDFATEFLGPKLSIGVVRSIDDAIEHINRFGSRHTDAIVTSEKSAAKRFTARVDTAVVLVNAALASMMVANLGLVQRFGISQTSSMRVARVAQGN